MDKSIKKTAGSVKMHSRALSNLKKHYRLLFLLIPGFILLLIFNYAPMFGLIISFKDYRMGLGILGSEWCGFDNFAEILRDTDFLKAFRNTLMISALKLLFSFPMPIILAILLNEMGHMGLKRTIQTVSYLPHFFSWVVLAGIFKMVFATVGPVNQILSYFGIEAINFFADKNWFLFTIIFTDIWQSVGWGSIVFLAAISGIDQSMYEAGAMDGMNRWQSIKYITLPSLVPTIITVLILKLAHVLNVGFDQIYNMYNPLVYDVSEIIDTYVLVKLEDMDYAIGTAVGFFKSIVCLILVVTSNYWTKKISGGEQGIW